MAKPIPTAQNPPRVRVRAKGKSKKFPTGPQRADHFSWMVVGFDQSASSIAGAAVAYDHVLRKMKGPEFLMVRWGKNDHYFDRLAEAGRSHNFIIGLMTKLKVSLGLSQVWIAQEEPFPPGGSFTGRGHSQSLKQQAEISGALLAGLLRYGYTQIWQIGNHSWRQLVAGELGITIHHSKWRSPELAERFNCKPQDSGKFRAKEWALTLEQADALGSVEIPDWPDLINSKDGKIPRPEKSRAKAVQSDDRYEALAIMEFLRRDLAGHGAISNSP